MKNILIVVFILFTGFQLVAQKNRVQACDPSPNYQVKKEETIKGKDYIYKLVHQKAQPKDGLQKFYKDFENEFMKPKLSDGTK